MKEMDKRLIAPLILYAVSPLGYAAQNCEATAGIAAGAADYLYETAQVKTTSRLHFNSAPDVECQLPAFLVNGNTVEVLREARSAQSADAPVHTFRYVRYRDAKGMFATGWVAAEGLVPLTTPLSVNPACKKWAHKEMPQRERMPPLLIIIIRLQATIAPGFIPCQRNSAAASPFFGSRRHYFHTRAVKR
ncbi:hypothetical protein PXV97_14290 [Citrobacter freundii]|nr:hypothetical protein PXV97_14290 [Citrobacter freundii]